MVKDEKVYEIYCLSCPITGKPRYIGKANDSKKRLASHIRDSRRRNTPVYVWMRDLLKKGLKPNLEVVETTHDWISSEKRIIGEYLKKYPDLLNVAPGGNEPFCSKETRAQNGRKVAHKIHHTDPVLKRIWKKKQMLACEFKKGNVSKTVREKVFWMAREYPEYMGSFLKYENQE